jgi:hypothetical protein
MPSFQIHTKKMLTIQVPTQSTTPVYDSINVIDLCNSDDDTVYDPESSDEDEYDISDPFVNDGNIKQEPEIELGLREEIGSKRKRKQTDRYAPIEQVCNDDEEDEEDEEDEVNQPVKKCKHEESEYEYSGSEYSDESDSDSDSDDSDSDEE